MDRLPTAAAGCRRRLLAAGGGCWLPAAGSCLLLLAAVGCRWLLLAAGDATGDALWCGH